MANLYFRYATMNAGKSYDLIKVANNYEEKGVKVLTLKPSIDTKEKNYISSRIGIKREADYLIDGSIIELLTGKLDDVSCIFVDEAQFLTAKQVDELDIISKVLDIPVVCYGLRVNFQNKMFEGSKRLMELADELSQIETMCECGNIARSVGRKVSGEYVSSGDEVIIDGEDDIEYVPLCEECYLKKVKKLNFNKIKQKIKR